MNLEGDISSAGVTSSEVRCHQGMFLCRDFCKATYMAPWFFGFSDLRPLREEQKNPSRKNTVSRADWWQPMWVYYETGRIVFALLQKCCKGEHATENSLAFWWDVSLWTLTFLYLITARLQFTKGSPLGGKVPFNLWWMKCDPPFFFDPKRLTRSPKRLTRSPNSLIHDFFQGTWCVLMTGCFIHIFFLQNKFYLKLLKAWRSQKVHPFFASGRIRIREKERYYLHMVFLLG